jgi:hypothetical protein
MAAPECAPPALPFPRTVHSGAFVKDSRRISKNLAGWPDCGERFAVIRLTNCGEANTTKAKPALEGRALFGDEKRKFRASQPWISSKFVTESSGNNRFRYRECLPRF